MLTPLYAGIFVNRFCYFLFQVSIRDILMARSGRQGLLRVIAEDLPEIRCFSLVFEDAKRKPLNFVASSNESAKSWVKGINFIKKKLTTLLPRLQQELYPFYNVCVFVNYSIKLISTKFLGSFSASYYSPVCCDVITIHDSELRVSYFLEIWKWPP